MTSTAPALIRAIAAGEMVILLDDPGRENEGDLVMAAQAITPSHMNFMTQYGRGMICLTMEAEQAERLALTPQPQRGQRRHGPLLLTSIEAAYGISTGISAFDRAHTIMVASHPEATASDINTPGHIIPILSHPKGLKGRQGHTEASVALAQQAGWSASAVICEILDSDGTMARLPALERFAQRHGLVLGFISDLIEHLQIQQESLSFETILEAV